MATTNELNELVSQIKELRGQEAQASAAKKAITTELEMAEEKMLKLLEDSDLKSYKAPEGLVSLSFFTSVKTPKTREDIEALAEYARSVGKYDFVFKPGSASVNSFYKEQLELAKEQGKDDFEVPGLKEVTIEPRLSFRTAK